jgi:AraC-like DNA-binding protein
MQLGRPKPPFYVLPVYVRLLLLLLESKGIDSAGALAGSGVTMATLRTNQSLVDFPAAQLIVRNALRLTGNDGLGLEVGDMVRPYHGYPGLAAATSNTVQQALHHMSRYGRLLFDGVDFAFSRTANSGVLSIIEHSPLDDTRIFWLESMAATSCQLLRALTGMPFDGLTVAFPYPRPAWSTRYDLLGAEAVVFDAPEMACTIPLSILDVRCVSADAESCRLACDECEKALCTRTRKDIVLQVNRYLSARVGRYPTLNEFAHDHGMSSRTVIRQLAARGTAYQRLLDAARQKQAIWYLRNTHDSIESIACQLGYADASNFSRTCRRWFQVSPSAIRDAPSAPQEEQGG